MKKYFHQLSAVLIFSLLLSSNLFAQNNLAAGDLAFVSYQSDTDPTNTFSTSVLDFDDRFSIVVLKPGGLAAGTVIYITDRGWDGPNNIWLDEAYPPFTFGIGSEAVIKWVIPAGGIIQGKEVFFIGKYHDELPAGSEYYQWFAYSDESGTTPLGTITNETPIVPTSIPPPNGFTDGMSLFSAGDNILVFQTGPPAGAPTNYNDATRRFITAILANIRPTNVGTPTSYASWDVAPNVQNESSIPPGLINGQTCFLMSPGPLPHPTAPVPGAVEPDNGKFSNCALSSAGACTALQMAAIIYNIANWTYSNSVFPVGTSSSKCTYTLSLPTPTITPGSATTFCTGGSVVLSSNSVSGNQWYVGGNAINNATNQTFTASASGTYRVVVTSNGCSSSPSAGTAVTVNVPTTSETTISICNKYTWNGTEYKESGDYVFHTTNAAGCDSAATLHLTILSVTSNISKTDATCFGTGTGSITVTPTYGVSPFSYRIGTVAAYGASNTFNNLRAGSYRVSILDANGCAGITSQVIITQPIAVTGTSVVTNATCYGLANGSITVTPTTGTAPHTYRLDNIGTFTSSNVFNNVNAGAYRVYIKDANSCVGSIVVTVTQPTKVSGTSTKTDETCPNAKNGSITVTGAGGTAPYSYRYGGTGSFTSNNTFNNLKAGSYRVYVNDANGCSGFSILTTVGQTSGSCFTARTGLPEIEPSNSNLKVSITPNPSNRQFTLQVNSTKKESVQIRVMDVNGRTVHTIKGITEKMYRFGEQFAPGLYMIEVRQGEEAKTLKAVKN